MTEKYTSNPDTAQDSSLEQAGEASVAVSLDMREVPTTVEAERRGEIATGMAGVALSNEVVVAEEAVESEVPAEQGNETTEIDEKLDALYAKAKVFLEDSSKEDMAQGQQLDALKEALVAITAQLNEAGQAAFAGNYMHNHQQLIGQIDGLIRQAELPLSYNQDAKEQETVVMIDEMRRVGEATKAIDPSNPRVVELENLVLNLTNVGAMYYEDKRLRATLRNFNQSAHDGYTTVSDVQQMIALLNALVQDAAQVTYRKAQFKRQLLEQAH